MGDRRCCCGCGGFFDHFQRADSTYLGNDWEERVGLLYPADGDVRINYHSVRFVGGVPNAHATVKPASSLALGPASSIEAVVQDAQPGKTAVLFVNYVDWNRHYRVEYEFGGQGGSGSYEYLVKLLKVAYNPGAPTVLHSEAGHYTRGAHVRIGCCFTRYLFGASRPHGYGTTWTVNPGFYVAGTRFGLGASGSVYPVDYDYILMEEAWHTSRTNCPACGCHCDFSPRAKFGVPMDLTGTFVQTHGCPNLHGTTFDIKTGGDPYAEWYVNHTFRTTTCEYEPGKGFEIVGRLTCPSGDIRRARFDSNLQGPVYATAQSTCSPLLMVFGPYTVGSGNQGHCDDGLGQPCTSQDGGFYIHVTG